MGTSFFVARILNKQTAASESEEDPTIKKETDQTASVVEEVVQASPTLFLSEIELNMLPPEQRDAKVEEFKKGNPPDVRTLDNATELEVGGNPIHLTIRKKDGYHKIPMSYINGHKKQLLQIGKRYFLVRYLKTEGFLSNRTFPASVSKSVKQGAGLINTGSYLGFTEDIDMPFETIQQTVETLTTEDSLKGEMLAGHQTGERFFYYVLLPDIDITNEKSVADALGKATIENEREKAWSLLKSVKIK